MRTVLFVMLALFVIIVPTALADDVLQGDRCVIEAGTIHKGDLFALCRTLLVDGEIEGHLYAATAAAQINGKIDGDIYLLGGQTTVSGSVAGSTTFVGALLQFAENSQLTAPMGSVNSLSLSTLISSSSSIPGSVTAAGFQLIIDGTVGRSVHFWGTGLAIDGTVTDDVDAQVGGEGTTGAPEFLTILTPDARLIPPGLSIGANGRIDGTLRYTGPVPGQIDGTLAHEPEYTPIEPVVALPPTSDLPDALSIWISRLTVELVVALIFAGLLLVAAQRPIVGIADVLVERPRSSILIGLGTFVAIIPVSLMLLLISIVLMIGLAGLRLGTVALLVGFVVNILNVGLASSIIFAGLFLARMIAAYAFGRWILQRVLPLTWQEQRRIVIVMLFGVLLMALLASLPWIGWLLSLLASLIGTGAAIRFIDGRLRQPRQRPVAQAVAQNPSLHTRLVPPPIVEDRSVAPGMEHLPDGFNWWE